jgi:hypothetical protein
MAKVDPKAVIRAYKRHRTQRKAAEALGVSQGFVSATLRSQGILIGKGCNQPRPDNERVLALWRELGNQSKVARRMGIPQATVSQILIRNGIRIGRGRREPTHKLPMDEVAARYRAGESCIDLGRAYGVSDEVIRRRLKSAGVSRRGLQESRARGPKNSQYKHGRKYSPMHHYRRQSYEVAAICLGQPLERGWVIHHLDENPHNNRPENLILFPSQRHHSRFHQRQSALLASGQPVDAIRLALEIGGRQLPPPPNPIAL